MPRSYIMSDYRSIATHSAGFRLVQGPVDASHLNCRRGRSCCLAAFYFIVCLDAGIGCILARPATNMDPLSWQKKASKAVGLITALFFTPVSSYTLTALSKVN